ncbi:MAG: hypothetical protein CVU87_07185 [Firmicutes bacterium HGW-Firmicutes-12]|jgi:uncharacterized protein YrrD|nr:MAG: hypothetical protein CVU87_07185 [Firmicutes bacterium HGW-Firmicutes-12]
MKKGRDYIEKPIIDVDSGKLLGYVEGFKTDEDQRIAGIYLKTVHKEQAYLPFAMVSSLGRDAVLVQGPLVVSSLEKVVEKRAGSLVMTVSGDSMGTIEDIILEEKDGTITGYEVSDGLLMDVVMGRKIVPTSNVLAYHEDAVIIGDTHPD